MLFEKHLPSIGIKKLLVTPEIVENPERELKKIDSSDGAMDPEMEGRFERAAANEKERVKRIIAERAREFEAQSALRLYEDRIDLIAEYTLRSISDIDSALIDFQGMCNQIKTQNEGLFSQLGIDVRLADTAIDEIVRIAIVQDRDIGEICLNLANGLEYGLKLVRDRVGLEAFTITREAVLDPENYIDSLIKRYYSQEPAAS